MGEVVSNVGPGVRGFALAAEAQHSVAESREGISESVARRHHHGLNNHRGVVVVCAKWALRVAVKP